MSAELLSPYASSLPTRWCRFHVLTVGLELNTRVLLYTLLFANDPWQQPMCVCIAVCLCVWAIHVVKRRLITPTRQRPIFREAASHSVTGYIFFCVFASRQEVDAFILFTLASSFICRFLAPQAINMQYAVLWLVTRSECFFVECARTDELHTHNTNQMIYY